MKDLTRRQLAVANAVAVAAGLLPIALFWCFFGRAPSVSVPEAKALLSSSNVALVDIRSPEAFASNRVSGAVNWPWARIKSARSVQDVPPELREKKLLLLCEVGLSSALAARHLEAIGIPQVASIKRGRLAWLDHGDGHTSELPVRPLPVAQQWLAVTVAFGLKPTYMLLSLLLIVWLWRRRAADLALLRWGLIWFWMGENACSIDYLFFDRASDFWEYLHGYGMAVSFSFIAYAFLDGLDYRFVKLSPEKERCAALGLCRACMKYGDAPCGLKRLFEVMIPAFALLSLLPLTARFDLTSYNTTILGTVHNYHHLVTSQIFELRFCAVVALALFIASWLVLRFKRTQAVAASKVLFAAALGPLSFGVLRLFFVFTFTDNLLWFDVWEEVTEFLFILSIGMTLWVFRAALLGSGISPSTIHHEAPAAPQ